MKLCILNKDFYCLVYYFHGFLRILVVVLIYYCIGFQKRCTAVHAYLFLL